MTRIDQEVNETEYVEELRRRLKGLMSPEMYNDDSMFLRFLKARNFDLKATENMLRNYFNWRKVHRVDNITEWYIPHEVLENYMGLQPIAIDKEGAPVIYFHFGQSDLRGIVSAVKQSEVNNFVIRRLELDIKMMKTQSEKINKNVEKWTYIFDFDCISVATVTHKPCAELARKMFALYEANYPEMLKTAYLINTSWIFQIGFSLIKPLLSGPTLQKVKVFGKDGWKEELLSFIDEKELPVFLGGKKTDAYGDPNCRSIVKLGIIPKRYFLTNQIGNFSSQKGVKKVIVNRLSKERVEINVEFPDSVVEWEFQTKERDIDFTFLYKRGTDVEEIIPKRRCEASMYSEVGFFKCVKAGTYYLEFDNTYSWVHQKELYYKYKIVDPNHESQVFDNE